MNIAFFLVPKCNVAFLYEDNTLRQGIEKMKFHGYTSIPVITNDGKYAGSISEGDFLWYIIDDEEKELTKISPKNIENKKIKDVIKIDRTPPVLITASMETLLVRAMDQNYVPVVDDRGTFMGIITRRDIIRHYYNEHFFSDDDTQEEEIHSLQSVLAH